MRRSNLFLVSIFLSIFLTYSLAGCDGANEIINHRPPNHPPEWGEPPIIGIPATTVILGQRVELTANATDPDDDPILYNWKVTNIENGVDVTHFLTPSPPNKGTTKVFRPPTSGTYSIVVVASDGEFSVSISLQFVVTTL